MITFEQATKNLKAILKEATSEHYIKGKRWYVDAHNFCAKIAIDYNVELSKVVGVLAALSPQCSWDINKRETENLIQYGEVQGYTGYPANVNKAKEILLGNRTPIEVLTTNKQTGHKVRAFYDNVLSPYTSKLVTIDTHASRAAFNRMVLTQKEVSFVFRTKGNRILQAAYASLADKHAMVPCELQAVIWLVVKDKLSKGE